MNTKKIRDCGMLTLNEKSVSHPFQGSGITREEKTERMQEPAKVGDCSKTVFLDMTGLTDTQFHNRWDRIHKPVRASQPKSQQNFVFRSDKVPPLPEELLWLLEEGESVFVIW